MPQYLKKYCQSFSMSCGFFLSVLLVLYAMMMSMRVENVIRRAFALWLHDDANPPDPDPAADDFMRNWAQSSTP